MNPAQRPDAPHHGPSVLALVRHGESTWLAESRFQGRGDPPLTDLGRRQAQAVGARLAAPGASPALPLPPEAPIAIYHSPLVRAADTARAIHDARGGDTPLVAVAELTEIAQGRWEGLTHDEVRERYADELAAWRRDPTRHHAPEGEPLVVAVERARVAAKSILDSGARELASGVPGVPASDDEGQPPEPVLGYERRYGSPEQARRTDWAIVVAHDGILRLLMLDLLGADIAGFWSYPFALAAVTVLDRSGGLVRLRAHNLDEHNTALTR